MNETLWIEARIQLPHNLVDHNNKDGCFRAKTNRVLIHCPKTLRSRTRKSIANPKPLERISPAQNQMFLSCDEPCGPEGGDHRQRH
jgi:hypothetical protein